MNFEQLKQLTKKVGSLIVFNGEKPEFVVLAYNKFEELGNSAKINNIAESVPFFETNSSGLDQNQEEEEIQKLNDEILALKEEVRQHESAELNFVESAEDTRMGDT